VNLRASPSFGLLESLVKLTINTLKLPSLKAILVWHKHDSEDELFYIVKGQLIIQLETGSVELNEGDFYIIPKGVMHNPVAEGECWIVLIETVSTKHTGDVDSPLTKTIAQQLI
jgi:mannose-6-phosphate isomerase-like protein (cupin superfamily)